MLGRTYQPTVTARALIGSGIYVLNYHHLDLIQFIQSYHSSKRTPKLAQIWTFYGRGVRSDGIPLVQPLMLVQMLIVSLCANLKKTVIIF